MSCEGALWTAGTFFEAYRGNRDHAVEKVIEADPVAAAVRAIMAGQTEPTTIANNSDGALLRSSRDS